MAPTTLQFQLAKWLDREFAPTLSLRMPATRTHDKMLVTRYRQCLGQFDKLIQDLAQFKEEPRLQWKVLMVTPATIQHAPLISSNRTTSLRLQMMDELGRLKACGSSMGLYSTKQEESAFKGQIFQLAPEVLRQVSKLLEQLKKNLQDSHLAISLLLADGTSERDESPHFEFVLDDETTAHDEHHDLEPENDNSTSDLENLLSDVTHIINCFHRLSQTTTMVNTTIPGIPGGFLADHKFHEASPLSCVGFPPYTEISSYSEMVCKDQVSTHCIVTPRAFSEKPYSETIVWFWRMKLRRLLARRHLNPTSNG